MAKPHGTHDVSALLIPNMAFRIERKTKPVASALKKRFPGQNVINVIGVRREESASRAKQPVSKPDPNVVSRGMEGATWNAIIDMKRTEVTSYIEGSGLTLHPGYTEHGMTRISCAFCIMASAADLAASATYEGNHAIYREMVDLEVRSTFSLQSGKWLGDLRPDLLAPEMVFALEEAKRKAELRQAAEARIPENMLYVKGWPVAVPTWAEASLLAEIRSSVAEIVGLQINFRDPGSIIDRYEELMELAASKSKSRDAVDDHDDDAPGRLIPAKQLDSSCSAWPF